MKSTGKNDYKYRMNDKKLNCKNCEYKYCPFRGSDREICAYFCEDYEPAEEDE